MSDLRDAAVQLLARSRLRLVEVGWVPHGGGGYGAGSAPLCLLNTMERVSGRDDEAFTLAYRTVLDRLEARGEGRTIGMWNDRQSSVDTVLALVDESVSELLRG